MASLDDLINILDRTPVIANIHPVSTCYLPEDVTVASSADEVSWLLDDPNTTLSRRLLITDLDPQASERFPHVYCEHDPFTPALNTILFARYESIASQMLCQSQIAARIVAQAHRCDLIVLCLIDGMAYHEVRDWDRIDDWATTIEPCLVDTPTMTETAFPNLVGNPSLAMRLFDLGFHNQLGLSYWTREDNLLTDCMFRGIANVSKIGHVSQLLSAIQIYLDSHRQAKSFVQIMRTGLDGYAHAQKRHPPVSAIVQEIRQEFASVAMLCEKLEKRACLYLTADHGILWGSEFEPEIVGNAPGKSSSRWYGWNDAYQQRTKGKRFIVNGREYYCLSFPQLRRPLRIDEQGVHGGISFQESVVPFLTVKVENPC